MKKEVAKELRKNAGIIASARYGKEIRNAMSNSLEALASFTDEEELPVKKIMDRCYLKGITWGIGIAVCIIGVLTVIGRQI